MWVNDPRLLSNRPIPVQHAQGAQCDPPARLVHSLIQLDRHLAGILDLERPAARLVALGDYQVDRLTYSRFGRDPRAAQVFESPQHVVVPPGREGEAGPGGLAAPGPRAGL